MDNAYETAEVNMVGMIGNEINSRKQNERLQVNLDMNRKERDFLEEDKTVVQEMNSRIDEQIKQNQVGLEQFKDINHQQNQKKKVLQDRIEFSKQFIASEINNY